MRHHGVRRSSGASALGVGTMRRTVPLGRETTSIGCALMPLHPEASGHGRQELYRVEAAGGSSGSRCSVSIGSTWAVE